MPWSGLLGSLPYYRSRARVPTGRRLTLPGVLDILRSVSSLVVTPATRAAGNALPWGAEDAGLAAPLIEVPGKLRRSTIFRSVRCCLLLGLVFILAATKAPAGEPSSVGFQSLPPLGHGITVGLGQNEAVPASADPENPWFVRLVVRWEQVERARGQWQFEELDRAVESYRKAGYRVILCITGGNSAVQGCLGAGPSPVEAHTGCRTVDARRDPVDACVAASGLRRRAR